MCAEGIKALIFHEDMEYVSNRIKVKWMLLSSSDCLCRIYCQDSIIKHCKFGAFWQNVLITLQNCIIYSKIRWSEVGTPSDNECRASTSLLPLFKTCNFSRHSFYLIYFLKKEQTKAPRVKCNETSKSTQETPGFQGDLHKYRNLFVACKMQILTNTLF